MGRREELIRIRARAASATPDFDDALDDDETGVPDSEESGRAPAGGQDNDEATAGDSADVMEEPDPFGDDLLVGSITLNH